MPIPFIKMHGLGNDFVIIDARAQPFVPTPSLVRAIADRHRGVGCDQLILLGPPRASEADLFMTIFNNDGSRAGACGNAARCIGRTEMAARNKEYLTIETDACLLRAEKKMNGYVAVDMGPALLEWHDIPLAYEMNTLAIDTGKTGLPLAVAVSMGNPHAVFFMDDVDGIDIAGIGPQIENHPLFPERTNVAFAEVKDRQHIRLRTWERGTGITQACGSNACATLVAAVRRGLTERKAEMILDGGSLIIEWLENGPKKDHVMMEGPASYSFSGVLPDDILEAA